MGEICMKYFAQIISFFVWVIGTGTSVLAKVSPVIDDSISLIAGVIGVIGGLVWLSILRIKKRNEKLDNEIKLIELKRLKEGK